MSSTGSGRGNGASLFDRSRFENQFAAGSGRGSNSLTSFLIRQRESEIKGESNALPTTPKKSQTTYPKISVSDVFKKIDTRLPRVTISNPYPQLEDRNLSQAQFLSGVRQSYQKGILRGSGTRGSGTGSGAGSGVNHTATSLNGGVHINTYNIHGSLFTQSNPNIKLPKPFGYIDTDWTSYKIVDKNLEGRDTTLRFFVRFTESNNVYISKQLRLDLAYANRNGNPYFTSHLIPEIKLDKRKLNLLWQAFQQQEEEWKNFSIGIGLSAEIQEYSLEYLPIKDSLGTEVGEVGEIEIFKYIDSLLKSPPTGETPEFIEPYRKGTVIETAWYSSNPRGFGMDVLQKDIVDGFDDGASSGVGAGTSSGAGAGTSSGAGVGTSSGVSIGPGNNSTDGGTIPVGGGGTVGNEIDYDTYDTEAPYDTYDPYEDRVNDPDDRLEY